MTSDNLKFKTLMNIFWNPCQECRQLVESRDDIVCISTNTALKEDDWCKSHVLFEQDFPYNLADLNRSICEGTTILLAAHNKDALGLSDADYIGFCHYRRFVPKSSIEKALQQNPDIVCINPGGIGKCSSIEMQYHLAHYKDDWDMLHEQCTTRPWFSEDIWKRWKGLPSLLAPCNMLYLKSQLFDEWCGEIEGIILPLVQKIDVSGRDNYQKRALGFLMERLTSFWTYYKLVHDKMKVFAARHEFHEDWKPKDAQDKRGNFKTAEGSV